MNAVPSQNIKDTLNYASLFKLPLTIDKLHLFLISSQKSSLTQVKNALRKSPHLKRRIVHSHHSLLKYRQKTSQEKMKLAQEVVKFFSFIPTIKAVLVTGSLAVNNAKPKDDIDLMIITQKNSLWFTRLLLIPLLSLFFKRRQPQKPNNQNSICPNLWLDKLSLAVPKAKRNLYTAHETIQAKPLLDKDHTHHQFLTANQWVKNYLANAYHHFYHQSETNLPSAKKTNSKGTQIINNLINFPVYLLNLIAFLGQYLYMKRKITNETISLHSAYFHPYNPYQKIKQQLKTK